MEERIKALEREIELLKRIKQLEEEIQALRNQFYIPCPHTIPYLPYQPINPWPQLPWYVTTTQGGET